jgi:hypothetical protein
VSRERPKIAIATRPAIRAGETSAMTNDWRCTRASSGLATTPVRIREARCSGALVPRNELLDYPAMYLVNGKKERWVDR